MAFLCNFLSPTFVLGGLWESYNVNSRSYILRHCLYAFVLPLRVASTSSWVQYPNCFHSRLSAGAVLGDAAVRAGGKSGGSLSLPGPCALKHGAEATLAWSCRHNCWDRNPMTSKALFQSIHSSFMHSVHCFVFLIQIIFSFGGTGHLRCISVS